MPKRPAWIRALTDPAAGNHLIIARVTWVEVLSALARRQREGGLPARDIARAVDAFRYDVDTQYEMAEVERTVAEQAGILVMRYPLRAYDALQLACASRIQASLRQRSGPALTFITADERLGSVAERRAWRRTIRTGMAEASSALVEQV
jgi:hypothetical protein